MQLSVIIVTWNNEDIILECLKSLENVDMSYEVIVVDNASTDRTVQLIKQNCKDCKLIVNEDNEGFAKANNKGIGIAKGDFYLFLNSDAFLTQNSISVIMREISNDRSIGIAGPQLVYPDKTYQKSTGSYPGILDVLLQILFLYEIIQKTVRSFHARSRNNIDVDYVDGACMLVRRDVIEHVGMFDEEYRFYSEDMDLCYRARMAGWYVINIPEAKVVHLRGASSLLKDKYVYIEPLILTRNMFVKKYYSGLYSWIWRKLMIISLYERITVNRIRNVARSNKDDITRINKLLKKTIDKLKRSE